MGILSNLIFGSAYNKYTLEGTQIECHFSASKLEPRVSEIMRRRLSAMVSRNTYGDGQEVFASNNIQQSCLWTLHEHIYGNIGTQTKNDQNLYNE